MAIITSMWLRGSSQKLGGAVLYNAMGQTRARELAANVTNPRTSSQMTQRTKWANLVNFYRANASWMKFAYETKAQNQSEYNKFMQLNVASSRIYLPKTLASQGACVVDAYKMTQGSLASIEVTKAQNGWTTNLYMQNTGSLDENMTVGEFTQSILPVNPALREGDQISFIRFTQMTNNSTGVPYVVVRKYEVILNSTDVRRFYDFMPEDYIGPAQSPQNDCLFVSDSGNAGGFILILSRTIGGKTYVSTQSIIVANNSASIDAYSSNAAIQAAIDSYGDSAEPFLTSSSANEDSQAATRLAILGINLNGNNYAAGSAVYPVQINEEQTFKVMFNADVSEQGPLSGTIRWIKGGVITSAEISPNIVTGSTAEMLVEGGGPETNVALMDVTIQVAGTNYRAVFVVPNEATIGGLE